MTTQSKSQLIPWIVTALACALLLGLGTWQIQRKMWKEGLLAAIEARAKLPPLTNKDFEALKCEPDKGLLDPCEFRPVAVTAEFQAGLTRHIFISVPKQANGIGGPGYWAFTSASLVASPLVLFVNRGFIPQAKKDSPIAAEPTANTTSIIGVLRRAEERVRFSGANDHAKNIYYVRDPQELVVGNGLVQPPLTQAMPSWATALSSRYYIDMTGPVPPGNLPYPMVGKITIPNRHLEYALTWYALAATLLGVAFFRFRRTPASTE